MPHPMTTTFLGLALVCAICASMLGAALVVALILSVFALVLEGSRFWMSGSEPAPTTEVLVRSGEQAPEEQGRTTLLRG
jgi:hypothetical protein